MVLHVPGAAAGETTRISVGESLRVPAGATVEAIADDPAELLVVYGAGA